MIWRECWYLPVTELKRSTECSEPHIFSAVPRIPGVAATVDISRQKYPDSWEKQAAAGVLLNKALKTWKRSSFETENYVARFSLIAFITQQRASHVQIQKEQLSYLDWNMKYDDKNFWTMEDPGLSLSAGLETPWGPPRRARESVWGEGGSRLPRSDCWPCDPALDKQKMMDGCKKKKKREREP